uniref:MLX-interacting protein-like isoform X4 n=1 Tax=Myxine glutinosa TaxID=7769 RepID=UPI00358F3232
MRGRSVSAEGLREEREKRQWGTADRSGEWRECQVAIKREPMVVYEAGVKTEGMAKPKAEIASGNLGENKKYNRYHKSDAVQSKFGGAEEEESAILGEVAEGVLGMEEEEEEYDDVESLSDANDAKRTSSEDHKAPIIHSGHFMVSRPHNERPGQRRRASTTFNHMALRTYRFGPGSRLSIDGSLTKLFECMSLAYSGGLVSPKWKTFKGLRLQWKDKIRLNNAIWRAWYLQYVKRQKNPVCHFMTPLEGTDDESRKMEVAEAVILEGKYWKKRFHFVIEEYHRWRTYFKKRVQRIKDDPYLSNLATEEGKGERVAIHPQTPPREEGESMDLPFDMDTLMSDFSDTLFSSLVPHASPWQHPRDIFAHTADMIQPALSQLQPTLEDFMDTMDPLQDFLSSGKFFVPALPPTNPAQISGEPQGLGDLSGRVLLSSSPVSSQSMAPSAAVATQIPSLTVRRQEMKSEPALQGGLEHRHSGPSPPPAFAPFVSVDSSPNVSLDWSKPEPPCKESGRMVPVTAEQKRRLNIHKGFSTLQNLVPVLHAHPNMKVSKATMLSKAAEYISKLQAERQAQAEEAARLRQQAAAFNLEISQCQAALPAGGVPLAGRRRASRMRQLLDDYVRSRTQQTWQFWLFSVLLCPLFDSFVEAFSGVRPHEITSVAFTWLETRCSLPCLRPMVMNSLRVLSTSTSILSEPELLSEQALRAVDTVRHTHS